jgi:hypothetical protein
MRVINLFILLAVFPFTIYSQEPADNVFPIKDGNIFYEKIVVIDSASKAEIFKRTKIWAVDAFKSQKNALETEDKDEGFIIYKTNFTTPFTFPGIAAMPTPQTYSWRFFCSMRFLIKENKCKIIIYDFDFEGETVYKPKQKNSILNFRSITEPELKKNMMSKGNRVKFFNNANITFKRANSTVNEIIDSFEKMIKSRESLDF